MSLWTPGGEVPVNRNRPSTPSGSGPDAGAAAGARHVSTGAPGGAAASGGGTIDRSALSDEVLEEAAAAAGIDLESLSEDERAQLEEMLLGMAEAQARLADTPAEEVLVNHLGGFYELARIHLSQDPPHFDDAALAIDALGAVLETVGERLGQEGVALREAHGQLQMAFVQLRQRYEVDAPGEA